MTDPLAALIVPIAELMSDAARALQSHRSRIASGLLLGTLIASHSRLEHTRRVIVAAKAMTSRIGEASNDTAPAHGNGLTTKDRDEMEVSGGP